ncbi:hypothetical protein BW247_12090 [Acidihalobacter ferrooxydans]|uniref:Uncharacterized protein n=1 Tax=Acidihalobacter ferrooxydans TaxID=1765967 RepID=A0A1P8UIS5_9GAMM|nr:hypothetical protein BW247_12090 [Acidihalobacter ferrooxydans]
MKAILINRTRAETLLLDQIHEKSWCLPLEGIIRLVWATGADITRNRQLQHLTNGVTYFLSCVPCSRRTFSMGALPNPGLHKWFDVLRQLR